VPAAFTHPLSTGAYTLPDAARLLGLPLSRLRSWVRGALVAAEEEGERLRRFPAGPFETCSEGGDRHFDFLTLIELFTIAQLRKLGVKMATLRAGRAELAARYRTPHPFALKGLLTDGSRLLKELGGGALLEIGASGQTAFEAVIEPFCHRLDFDTASCLATRFYPAGRDSSIVVDPRHSFGRPVITGTNITTASIASLLRAGESSDDVAEDFRVNVAQIDAARAFELRAAA
jgi:uncharacterized protein (DUF433 family)